MPYHAFHIQDGYARIDVSFCCNGASREPNGECFFEFLNMIPNVAVHRSHLHKLVWINFPEPLDINRSPQLIYSMVTLRAVIFNFINLWKIEILQTKKTVKPFNRTARFDIF